MKKLVILLFSLPIFGFAQSSINIAKLDLKVPAFSEKKLYYSFKKGDKIIFYYKEDRDKNLKQIRVSRERLSPSTNYEVKLYKYKSSNESIVIDIDKTAVYSFYFKNSAIRKRICNVLIQRIPLKEDDNFSTSWKFNYHIDTSYIPYSIDSIVGYDTTYYTEKVKEKMFPVNIVAETFVKKDVEVHSNMNLDYGPKVLFSFNIPTSYNSDMRTERVIGWHYWIGVGDNASKLWQEGINSTISTLTNVYTGDFTGTSGNIAGNLLNLINNPNKDDNINYKIMRGNNGSLWLNNYQYQYYPEYSGDGHEKEKRISDVSQSYLQWHIGLENDNILYPVNVSIRLQVIKEVTNYEYKNYRRQKITNRTVRLNKRRMSIRKIPYRVPTSDY